MNTRTSATQPTVKPPEVSAAQIRLTCMIRSLEELDSYVSVVTESDVFFEDFKELRFELAEICALLEACKRPADRDRLRRVLTNCLKSQNEGRA